MFFSFVLYLNFCVTYLPNLSGRKWNIWETGSHWNLSQPCGLSYHCIQPEQHHSHKHHQHLQWQHQLRYLVWCFLLRHVFWSLQDISILHMYFLSGINSMLIHAMPPCFPPKHLSNFMSWPNIWDHETKDIIPMLEKSNFCPDSLMKNYNSILIDTIHHPMGVAPLNLWVGGPRFDPHKIESSEEL